MLVVGQVFGQPVLLGFVATGSMAPTLQAGDAFVAVPQQVAGDPDPGDVVVYEARTIRDGGLTTHRIVGETEDGYVTKGDANPFTDQDGGEPPVTESRIVATALEVDGDVVTIPGVGTAVVGVRETVLSLAASLADVVGVTSPVTAGNVGSALVGAGVLLYVGTVVAGRRGPATRDRSRTRRRKEVVDGRVLALLLLVLVLLPANLAMVAPSGVERIVVDGDRVPESATPGERVSAEFDASNGGFVAMFVVVDAGEEATVSRTDVRLPPGESTTLSLTTAAPPPGDERTVRLTEHRYLLLLPPSVVVALHQVDPVLAWAAIDLLIAASVLGVVSGSVGLARVRLRSRSRSVPVRRRIRDWLP